MVLVRCMRGVWGGCLYLYGLALSLFVRVCSLFDVGLCGLWWGLCPLPPQRGTAWFPS